MILVSACLAGSCCRYDGGHNLNKLCRELVEQGEAIPVCPETAANLPMPRPPSEIIGKDGHAVLTGQASVRDKLGQDLTQAFIQGSEAVLAVAKRCGATKAILKERSPSCGSSAIYDGSFSRSTKSGVGVTAALLMQHGIQVISEESFNKSGIGSRETEINIPAPGFPVPGPRFPTRL
jgi:uncharacterized protein YbbK (DUF523 family)